jgi:hypothetical protein
MLASGWLAAWNCNISRNDDEKHQNSEMYLLLWNGM